MQLNFSLAISIQSKYDGFYPINFKGRMDVYLRTKKKKKKGFECPVHKDLNF